VELRPDIYNGIEGYWRPNGSFMPIISGGAEDEPDPAGQGDEGDEEEEDEDDAKSGKGEDEIKDPVARIKSLEDQVGRMAKKNRRLEREARRREEEREQEESSKKDELTRTKDENTRLKEENDGLKNTMKKLEVQGLVLAHDAVAGLSKSRRKLVLRLIDLDEVEIDEDDGTSNIDEVIAALKEDEPDLFSTKKEESEEEEEEEEEEPAPRRKKTGRAPTKRKGSKEFDDSELRSRLPAIAKRRQTA
jgi:beta-glucosidase-like glycosyl hydrolase